MTDKDESVIASRRFSKYYTYIEPITSDPVIRGYFTLIASILLTAFFIIFALSPTFSTIVGLTRKIDDQKKVLASLDSKINSIILAQENYSRVEPDLPLLDRALPTKPEPDVVLQDVINTGSGSGVVLSSFQVSEVYLRGINPTEKAPEKKPQEQQQPAKNPGGTVVSSLGIPRLEFGVGMSGTRESIRQFAGRLEFLPRIVVISVLSIDSDNQGGQGGYFADIKGNAFYFPSTNLR